MRKIRYYLFCLFIYLTLIFLVSCSRSGKQTIIKSGNDISMFIATDIHYLASTLKDNGEVK